MSKTTFTKTVNRFSVASLLTAVAVFGLPVVTHADTLYRQLQTGMRGADVSSLQTFLGQDSTVYPQGLVTGYFGFLTKSAVANFQSKNGLPAVGRVGPSTLPVINAQMANGMNSASGGASAIISNVNINRGSTNATVSWNTNEVAKGVVYYSASPLSTYENTNSVTVSGYTAMSDSDLKSSNSVNLNNLQANTTYYYLIYTTDQEGNVSVTWPASFQTTN